MTSTEQLWARGISVQEPAQLGWQPIDITAVFSAGQDWIVTVLPPETPWPVGTAITVNVYAADTNTALPLDQWAQEFSWDATITNSTVYLQAPYADTDTVENGAIIRIMVVLPNTPTSDNYCWARGLVQRQD